MRRRLFAICACAALAGFAPPAGANIENDGLRAYAATLRAFDPALTVDDALRLTEHVVAGADAAGIDARLIVALVAVESSWNIAARSPAGARGLGQLMPATAAELGVEPSDAAANLRGTIAYLRLLLQHYAAYPAQQRYIAAIAAYNAGPGAVDRAAGRPPSAETATYVRRVMTLWQRLVSG